MAERDARLAEIRDLRRLLHRQAELSGQERDTAVIVAGELKACRPTELWTGLAGHGVAGIFTAPATAPGPTVVLRAELDAVPVDEPPTVEWASLQPGRSHKCGHDGHMALLVAVARGLRTRPLRRGRLVLLFQPGEETATGAELILRDRRYLALRPDWLFAPHNMPGYPLGAVVLREGVFTAGSVGVKIRLEGASSHAAYPDRGQPAAGALADLLPALRETTAPYRNDGELAMVTVTHAQLGEPSFGVSPGVAEVRAVLRSDSESILSLLQDAAAEAVDAVAGRHGLAAEVSWQEAFPVTANHPDAVALLMKSADRLGLPCLPPDECPIRWSEDFGWLIRDRCGALFGLGAGVDQSPLHSESYDFNDDLLSPGLELLDDLVDTLLR